MTDYATWLDRADINHGDDILYVTVAKGVSLGDRIVLYDYEHNLEPLWVTVLDVQETGWQKHRYAIRFECDRMVELREALTYHVAMKGENKQCVKKEH